MILRRWVAVALLSLLTGCSLAPGAASPTATSPQTAPAATPTPPTSPSPTSTPSGPVKLRIWVPPQFDPAAETPIAQLFRDRLDAFSRRRPNIQVEVRVKAVEGPGGMLESLTTASAAAPLALPDLIALPRPLLEAAALKGLLYSYDGLTTSLGEADWYPYALEMARLQDSVFGIPFGGDALVLVHRLGEEETPPITWTQAAEMGQALAFPAADPQALFTLTQYMASNGMVRDDQGRPVLQVEPLARLLGFYDSSRNSGLMPFWLTQFQTQDQAWDAFLDGRANLTLAWSSQYLADPVPGAQAAPLFTESGEAYTLMQGWVWALANPNIDRHPQTTELAEFLAESQFVAELAMAGSFLPARPSALAHWGEADMRSVFDQILLSAHLLPSSDVLNSLGAPLSNATVQVLKEQSSPSVAAQAAVNSLNNP